MFSSSICQLSSSTTSTALAHSVFTGSSRSWQQALTAFRHQLFAGQELTPDLAQRVTTIFERQGDAADLLRWWILFRCERVAPTVSEARALLYHNMWKQALYTSVIATPPKYTEFGHHAAIATCRSGNWRLALQLCQSWEAGKSQEELEEEEVPSAFLAAAEVGNRGDNKKQTMITDHHHHSEEETGEEKFIVPTWARALNAMIFASKNGK
jgi:hypothetical protein